MEPFFRQILDRTGRGERLATAMVVDSRGSTPQRIGARMLFFADGSSWGTVGGGCGLELDRWLEPGDVVELEVEGIGTLRNQVTRRE